MGQFTVSENSGKKASSDCFAAMDRDDRTSSVRMLEKMMAPSLANIFKPEFFQGFNKFQACDCGKGTHAGIVIR